MPDLDDEQLLRRVASHLEGLTSETLPDGLRQASVRSLEERYRRRWLPFLGGSLLIVATAATAIVVLAARHPTAQLTPAGLPTPGPSVPAVTSSPSGSPSASPSPSPSPFPSPSPSSPVVGTSLTLSGDRSGQLSAANSQTTCGSQRNGPSDPRYQYIEVDGTLNNLPMAVLVANPATQQAVVKSGVYVREGSPDQVSAGWQTTSTTGISHYSNVTGVSVDASLMPLTTYPYPQGGGPNARALLHISGQIVCAQ
jgi:hypothetical protein